MPGPSPYDPMTQRLNAASNNTPSRPGGLAPAGSMNTGDGDVSANMGVMADENTGGLAPAGTDRYGGNQIQTAGILSGRPYTRLEGRALPTGGLEEKNRTQPLDETF